MAMATQGPEICRLGSYDVDETFGSTQGIRGTMKMPLPHGWASAAVEVDAPLQPHTLTPTWPAQWGFEANSLASPAPAEEALGKIAGLHVPTRKRDNKIQDPQPLKQANGGTGTARVPTNGSTGADRALTEDCFGLPAPTRPAGTVASKIQQWESTARIGTQQGLGNQQEVAPRVAANREDSSQENTRRIDGFALPQARTSGKSQPDPYSGSRQHLQYADLQQGERSARSPNRDKTWEKTTHSQWGQFSGTDGKLEAQQIAEERVVNGFAVPARRRACRDREGQEATNRVADASASMQSTYKNRLPDATLRWNPLDHGRGGEGNTTNVESHLLTLHSNPNDAKSTACSMRAHWQSNDFGLEVPKKIDVGTLGLRATTSTSGGSNMPAPLGISHDAPTNNDTVMLGDPSLLERSLAPNTPAPDGVALRPPMVNEHVAVDGVSPPREWCMSSTQASAATVVSSSAVWREVPLEDDANSKPQWRLPVWQAVEIESSASAALHEQSRWQPPVWQAAEVEPSAPRALHEQSRWQPAMWQPVEEPHQQLGNSSALLPQTGKTARASIENQQQVARMPSASDIGRQESEQMFDVETTMSDERIIVPVCSEDAATSHEALGNRDADSGPCPWQPPHGHSQLSITTAAKSDVPLPRNAAPTSNLHQGDWHYICVDTSAVPTRQTCEIAAATSGELTYGDVVNICERRAGLGNDMAATDHVWLCLSDGRGWVIERTDRRHFSECRIQTSNQEFNGQLLVSPRVLKAIALQTTPVPYIGKNPDAESFKVCPGCLVRVLRQADVVISEKKSSQFGLKTTYVDVSRTFVEVMFTQGNADHLPPVKGWMPAFGANKERNLVQPDFRRTSTWLSVLSSTGIILHDLPSNYGKAMVNGTAATLAAGDFVCACETCAAAGLLFYRLESGLWVSERDSKSRSKLVEVVTREPHRYIYICDSVDGCAVRGKPTRAKNHDRDRKVFNKQRVAVSEIAKFLCGDTFLRLEPASPESWVPFSKTGSKASYMRQLRPLDDMANGQGHMTQQDQPHRHHQAGSSLSWHPPSGHSAGSNASLGSCWGSAQPSAHSVISAGHEMPSHTGTCWGYGAPPQPGFGFAGPGYNQR